MRILKRHNTHSGGLHIKLVLENPDDIWCLYNIVFENDIIECFTSRKIKSEDSSSICVKQEIKKFNIKLSVTSIEYISSYDDLNISGRNVSENPYIKIGQYHTVNLNINSTVTLYKEDWSKYCEDKLSNALNITKSVRQAFLILGNGTASLYLMTQYITKQVFKIVHNIPIRKSTIFRQTNTKKSYEVFFKLILERLVQYLDFTAVNTVVITGLNIVKESFFDFIKENALKLNHVDLHKNINKVVLCNSTFTDRNAISEILSDPVLSKKINGVQFFEHDKIILELKKKLEMNDNTVSIGIDSVQKAVELGAVQRMLISDYMIRSASANERKAIHQLIDNVRYHGGLVYFLSDGHCSTEYIKNLMGIVALLRFPIIQDDD